MWSDHESLLDSWMPRWRVEETKGMFDELKLKMRRIVFANT